ncbi:MAG TPA: nicotinate phosphoribosyltransferase, partial [Roseiflexaceae bacterium]|nr:nicotinate phosphoribosyltransferase [Roseiflexaceae bacterium]
TPRIALVDFDNDCVGTSLAVMDAMFARYRALLDAGNSDEAHRYKLYGVRPDTSATVRDVSVPPLGLKELDMGVTPRLVFFLRHAIDGAWQRWDLPPSWIERAQAWCRDVKIVVTGGFDPKKIRRFEELGVPVDIYGVGSSLFSNSSEEGTNNDFTADVVRVRLGHAWHDLVKVGRRACDNPDLQRIQ